MARRKVWMSVCIPVSVQVIVETDDDEPSEASDWTITEVVRVEAEASPTMINENAKDVDFAALYVAAARAKDIA